MQVIRDGVWLIAKDIQTLDMNGTEPRTANRVRTTYSCWTGKRCADRRSAALTFSSQEDGERYMVENWARLTE